MIYPIPNPSCATGPNPNSLNAGFPQFDVDKILVLSKDQPPSVNNAGSCRREASEGEAEGGGEGGGVRASVPVLEGVAVPVPGVPLGAMAVAVDPEPVLMMLGRADAPGEGERDDSLISRCRRQ